MDIISQKTPKTKCFGVFFYFGIFPKFGGTISLWFCSTIGSTSHFFAHPAQIIGIASIAHTNIIFFIISLPFYYSGNLTLSFIISTNSDSGMFSCCSTPRRRSVTIFSAISFSPTTAIIGVFANDSSRIL